MKKYLALDIGGSSIKYAMMDEKLNFYEQGKKKIGNTNIDDLLSDVKEVADMFDGQYEAVAISMPGRIDSEAGYAYSGGVFCFLINMPFAKMVSDKLGGAKVFIANDANCACRAELDAGSLQGTKGSCVLIIGSSVGGAVVINGKIWEGANHAAGEPAWLPLELKNVHAVPYRDALHSDGMSGEATSTTGLLNTYDIKKGREPAYTSEGGYEFFQAYDAGEPEALEAMEEFSHTMAAEIFSIQAMLDLEKYAIGGGISAHESVTRKIDEKVRELYIKYSETSVCRPDIVTCKFGQDANLIGAICFMLDNVL